MGPDQDPQEEIQASWLAPPPKVEKTRRCRYTEVSQDPRYAEGGLSPAEGDAECSTAPNRIYTPLDITHLSDPSFLRGGPRYCAGPHVCQRGAK